MATGKKILKDEVLTAQIQDSNSTKRSFLVQGLSSVQETQDPRSVTHGVILVNTPGDVIIQQTSDGDFTVKESFAKRDVFNIKLGGSYTILNQECAVILSQECE